LRGFAGLFFAPDTATIFLTRGAASPNARGVPRKALHVENGALRNDDRALRNEARPPRASNSQLRARLSAIENANARRDSAFASLQAMVEQLLEH
jgi:hypothetical protein